MVKYAIITFNFNGYDKIREPLIVDKDAEYICVTDKVVKSKNWKIVIDDKLVNRNPIYSSFYVRYHPFEYTDADVVIVVDASIQIRDKLTDIVEEFDKHGSNYGPMCTIYKTDEEKVTSWVDERKRLDKADGERIKAYIDRLGRKNERGSLGMAFSVYRKCIEVNRLLKHIWRHLIVLGNNGVPFRLDEIVAHKVLKYHLNELKVFPFSGQIIQSTYMLYCAHDSDIPVVPKSNYDQYFYMCNKPVSPVRFDKSINFPREYKFKTEAMLLTKYLNRADLIEWLDHHLNKVKFDHVHVFDNESNYDVKAVCDMYGDRVSYQKVYGQARQYRLYDGYINNISSAEWVMPIDDDEYLDIGEFDSLYDAIKYYENKLPHMMIFGIRWKHLFPKKFHSDRTGKVLEYCTEECPELAKTFMHLGDSTVKCIVKRYGNIHYEETWENPSGGHVPKHTCFMGAVMCDGRGVTTCGIPNCPDVLEDEKIRLLHCRYKGMKEWNDKYHNADQNWTFKSVSDVNRHKRKFLFEEILPELE